MSWLMTFLIFMGFLLGILLASFLVYSFLQGIFDLALALTDKEYDFTFNAWVTIVILFIGLISIFILIHSELIKHFQF